MATAWAGPAALPPARVARPCLRTGLPGEGAGHDLIAAARPGMQMNEAPADESQARMTATTTGDRCDLERTESALGNMRIGVPTLTQRDQSRT